MLTDQFAAAVRSFEQAVALLPHEPTDRHNFAVALAAVGEYGRAAEESRRAHELAPDNPDIKRFMDALIAHEETQRGTLNAQKGPN
jgi:Flp pilus assembly protein TadD